MSNQILENLRTKYAHLGLGDDVLKVYAKKIAKAVSNEDNEEKRAELTQSAIADYEDDLQLLQRHYDQSRNLLAEVKKLKEQVKIFENAPKASTAKETAQQAEEPQQDAQPTWLQDLMQQMKSVNDKLNVFEQKETARETMKRLKKELDAQGINANLYNLDKINPTEFQSQENIDNFVQDLKDRQTAMLQSFSNEKLSGALPQFGGANANKEQVSPQVMKYINSLNNKKTNQ